MSAVIAICKGDALARVVGGWILIVSCVFLTSLIIITFLRVARFLGGAAKEQKLTRIEIGKLAEEVHLLRQQLKDGGEQGASAEPE
jgi:hypothetical protein